jgi:hypothetical protein
MSMKTFREELLPLDRLDELEEELESESELEPELNMTIIEQVAAKIERNNRIPVLILRR